MPSCRALLLALAALALAAPGVLGECLGKKSLKVVPGVLSLAQSPTRETTACISYDPSWGWSADPAAFRARTEPAARRARDLVTDELRTTAIDKVKELLDIPADATGTYRGVQSFDACETSSVWAKNGTDTRERQLSLNLVLGWSWQASFLGEPEARQGWLGVEVRATYRLTANPARPAFTSFAYTLYRAKNVRPVEPPVTDPYAIDGYTVDSRCLSYRTWELGAGSAGLRARLGWASADLQQRVQAALGSPAAAARARAILELAAGANPSLQPTRAWLWYACEDRFIKDSDGSDAERRAQALFTLQYTYTAPDGLGGTATVTALLDVQAAAQYDWVGGRAANVRNFDYRLTTVEREPGSLPF